MSRKAMVVLAVYVIMVAGAVAVVGSHVSANDDADISIAVGTKNCYEPMWIAERLGYYADEGITVKSNYVDGGGNASVSLMEGSSDITLVGADPAIRMIARGGVVLVAGIEMPVKDSSREFAYRSGLGIDLNDASTLLNRNADGTSTVKVRCGMDTATGYYSGYLMYLYDQMQMGNITEAEYQLLGAVNDGSNGGGVVHVEFANQAVALVNGDVEMITSGNTVFIAESADVEIELGTYSLPSSGGTCYIFASEDTYNNNYDNLVRVLRAFDRACLYIQSDETRQGAAEMCARYYGATGWTVETQLEFFEGNFWDICMVTDVEGDLSIKAYLLGYENLDYESAVRVDAVRDAHIGVTQYDGLYMYDLNERKLVEA